MKRRRKEYDESQCKYMPTQAQIAEACEQIRREREAGMAPKRQYNRGEASVRIVEEVE